MKLYHGTSAQHLDTILSQGLKPRGKSTGNWSHTTKSRSDCVYLTDAYAPYFCFSAVNGVADAKCLVVEIDTEKMDPVLLLPDEDTLVHGVKPTGDIPTDMKKRTRYWRSRLLRFVGTDMWATSLKFLGTCAYKGIVPPEAITRYAVWPHKPNVTLAFVWDPTITPLNYKICGSSYRQGTQRLFGDVPYPNHVDSVVLKHLLDFKIKGLQRFERGEDRQFKPYERAEAA